MRNEFKIIEIFNPNAQNIEEKLKEVFISFLTEKLVNAKG